MKAGRRAGKTTIASYLVLAAAIRGGHAWAMAPRYEQADLCWGGAFVAARHLGIADEPHTSAAKGLLTILGTGGTVRRRTADAKGGNVGWGINEVVIDEAARCHRRVWEQDVRPTLGDFLGSAVKITTPGGHDWIYDEFQTWERGQSPDTDWISAPSWENEYAFPGGRMNPEILAAEREYSAAGLAALFCQEYGGEFVQMSGRVFQAWNPGQMVVDDDVAARGVSEWFVGYDWGWGHHSAWVLLGRVNGVGWRVLDEWGTAYGEWDQLVAGLWGLLQRNRLSVPQIGLVCLDPSRPEQAAALRRLGFAAVGAVNDLAEKILSVASAMARSGGFLVARRCAQTIRQIGMLRHVPPEASVGGKLQVIKKDDDYVDPVMYVMATIAHRERGAGDWAMARAR